MSITSREDYRSAASGGGAIPVRLSLLADMETPLSAYWKLAHNEPYSFLLESVTGGEQLGRYSMLGVKPRDVWRMIEGILHQNGEPAAFSGDPLSVILESSPRVRPELAEQLPRICGGSVGWISYDYVRSIERLPQTTSDDLNIEDIALMVFDQAVVFDHARNEIQVIVLADGSDEAYDRALVQIQEVTKRLRQPLPPLPQSPGEAPSFSANMEPSQYCQIVERCVQYIVAGDAFQIVPSQRLEAPCKAHPMLIYRALRSSNPSPYMYLLRMGDTDVVGASPEILVAKTRGKAKVRPIAGTRPRGANPVQDDQLASDLLKDEKERAEHIMLVDLGRNDLGRVSDYGSVQVKDLMVIEKYSHVMHLVSEVEGSLRPELTEADLVRATFPAGTLSGAPKVRAMEIIEELEPTRRGVYGGAVGCFSSTGDVELAIAIRTALLKGGKAYVQAGAGIVYDSVPMKEHQECMNKAMAVIRAIEKAHTGLD